MASGRTLDTISHTVGAIGVGNPAAAIWSDSNPWPTWFVVPIAMPLAILILSVLVPKTLVAYFWKSLATS